MWTTLPDAKYPFWLPSDSYYDASLPDKFEQFCYDYLVWPHGFRAGEPIVWADWQRDRVIRPMFGIRRKATDLRRIRTVFICAARGIGKTTFAGALGLFGLAAMNEPAPNVDLFAFSKPQASLMFKAIAHLVRNSPVLAQELSVKDASKVVEYKRTGGELVARTGDDNAEVGLNGHMILFDELLSQKDRALWDVIVTSMGKRPEGVLIVLTTPSKKVQVFAKREYMNAKEIQVDRKLDESYIPIIFEADKDDDMFAESTWHKACPALADKYIDIEIYRSEANAAQRDATKLHAFKVFRLALWADSGHGYINMDKWDENIADPPSIEDLVEMKCYIGVDMAGTTDIASACLLFYDDAAETCYALWRHWTTEVMSEKLNEWTQGLWSLWVQNPSVHVSEAKGRWISAVEVANTVIQDSDVFEPIGIGIDSFRSHELNKEFSEYELPVQLLAQTGRAMQASIERVSAMTSANKLFHNGDPIARWACNNADVIYDSQGYPKVVKKDLEERCVRIDPVDALCMAMDRRLEDERTPTEQVLDTRIIRIGAH